MEGKETGRQASKTAESERGGRQAGGPVSKQGREMEGEKRNKT